MQSFLLGVYQLQPDLYVMYAPFDVQSYVSFSPAATDTRGVHDMILISHL